MATLAPPKVPLKLVPVPKMTLYAGLAGEMLKNLGLTEDEQVTNVMQAVSESLVARVIVHAKHADGRLERFILSMKPFQATDTVNLALEPGKSLLETVDVSLAALVQQAANMIKQQNLKAEYLIDWSDRAKATPAIIAEAMKRLNLKGYTPPAPPVVTEPTYAPAYASTTTPPQPPLERYRQPINTYVAPPAPPANHRYVPVIKVEPEKDPGLTFEWITTRKV